ncbi:MAG: aspartate aminotransferase family protein [Caulobacter sp.]|nr:aspartate aminotransferase family protein [Caulobacter sp.]
MSTSTPSNPAQHHIMGVYNRAPLAFERGRGARLFSTTGEEYLDCVAGIATCGLGHAHPVLVDALKTQGEKLWHVSNIYTIPEQEELADKLCAATFADVVFFTNSGTEAIECALKAARRYHVVNGQPERVDIIGFDGSFHGRSYQITRDAGVLLIFDEVQSGMGRTGKLFAHEWASDAAPDIMAVAKALGGGFPVGACLASTEGARGMTPGVHGSTYGGNPLAMAVGKAAFDAINTPEILDNVKTVAGFFTQQLEGLKDRFPDVIVDIRGKGLLIGIKLIPNNREFMVLARDQKLLIAGGGDNCVRLLPPLNLTVEEASEAVAKLEKACEAARAKAAA